MLFNLFGKKENNDAGSVFKDKVYITSGAKMQACLQSAKEQPHSLFIAWFSETVTTYKTFFKENNIDDSRVTEARFVHASQLLNNSPVFLEHYPLHTKEIELVQKLNLGQAIVYSAMDEPLFKHFGSDKMIPLIKLLGMKENESIEHSFVTESIIKGQQKIAAKVIVEQMARSQGEWMEKNLTQA